MSGFDHGDHRVTTKDRLLVTKDRLTYWIGTPILSAGGASLLWWFGHGYWLWLAAALSILALWCALWQVIDALAHAENGTDDWDLVTFSRKHAERQQSGD